MGCLVNEGKLLHPVCSCQQAASLASKSSSHPLQGPEFVVGGTIRRTFPLFCYQLDDQILPLPGVGNKDMCQDMRRKMRDEQMPGRGERASS
jgi:hypothetical protein